MWSTLSTAAPILWTGGESFEGSLLLVLTLPELGTGNYPRAKIVGASQGFDWVEAPLRRRMLIRAGLLEANSKAQRTDKVVPPGSKYLDFWVDPNNVLISTGVSLFSIVADTHVIAPPTLTNPTSETSLPDISAESGQVTNLLTVAPLREDISGTKNGVNTAFTISAVTSVLMVYLNGQLLDEGVGYTYDGVTSITAIAPKIPFVNDSYEAVRWA